MKYSSYIKKLVKEKDRLGGFKDDLVVLLMTRFDAKKKVVGLIDDAIAKLHEAEIVLRDIY